MREQGWRGAAGIVAAVLWAYGLLAFRHSVIESPVWGAACVAGPGALPCLPRAAVLWLQQYGVWGLAATFAGLFAFRWQVLALPAVLLGLGGVIDYDVTLGMLGLCLGAWAWFTRPRASHTPAPAAPR